MKRIISVLLVFVMVFAFAPVAMADDADVTYTVITASSPSPGTTATDMAAALTAVSGGGQIIVQPANGAASATLTITENVTIPTGVTVIIDNVEVTATGTIALEKYGNVATVNNGKLILSYGATVTQAIAKDGNTNDLIEDYKYIGTEADYLYQLTPNSSIELQGLDASGATVSLADVLTASGVAVTVNGTVNMKANETLFLYRPGDTLIVKEGSVLNLGTGGEIEAWTGSTITNNGTINVAKGATIESQTGSTVTNSAKAVINLAEDATLISNGTVSNLGAINKDPMAKVEGTLAQGSNAVAVVTTPAESQTAAESQTTQAPPKTGEAPMNPIVLVALLASGCGFVSLLRKSRA